MLSFKQYFNQRVNENQGNQAFAQAQNNLMQTVQQQYKIDPNGTMNWFNNFLTKELPGQYKTMQQQQKQQPQQQQKQQPQQQQQQMQPQQPQQMQHPQQVQKPQMQQQQVQPQMQQPQVKS